MTSGIVVPNIPCMRNIDPIRPGPIRRHHRRIKSPHSTLIPKPHVQRRMVRVPHKHLRIRPHQLPIQQRQQLRRTPPASRTDHPVNTLIRKRCMKIGNPLRRSPRVIHRPPSQRMRHHHQLIPKRAQPRHTPLDQLHLSRTGRRHNRNPATCTQTRNSKLATRNSKQIPSAAPQRPATV